MEAQIDWAEAGFGTAIVPDFSLDPRLKLSREVTNSGLRHMELGSVEEHRLGLAPTPALASTSGLIV